MKRVGLPLFFAVFACIGLPSCNCPPCPAEPVESVPKASPPKHRLVVRSFIDGSDFLMIRGRRVWWVHREWDRPGLAGDQNRPTLLNGIPWWPAWSSQNTSRPTDADEELPLDVDAAVTVTPVRARGTVRLIEPPSKANDRTAKILFDDDGILGAAWYEVAIDWE